MREIFKARSETAGSSSLREVSCLVISYGSLSGAFINPHYEAMFLTTFLRDASPIIHKNEGVIEVSMSEDATKATFGISVEQPDHAVNAVETALELRRIVESFKGVNSDVNIGIGVNSGEAFCGNIGAPERFDFGAFGEAARETFNLSRLTHRVGHNVLIGEGTVQRLPQGRFRLRMEEVTDTRGQQIPVYIPE